VGAVLREGRGTARVGEMAAHQGPGPATARCGLLCRYRDGGVSARRVRAAGFPLGVCVFLDNGTGVPVFCAVRDGLDPVFRPVVPPSKPLGPNPVPTETPDPARPLARHKVCSGNESTVGLIFTLVVLMRLSLFIFTSTGEMAFVVVNSM